MITYELKEVRGNVRVFYYYPNDRRDDAGIIEFIGNEFSKIIKMPETDFKMYYTGHAIHGINPNSECGTVAWY